MSTPTSIWSIEHDHARLLSGPIGIGIELRRPERGLVIANDSSPKLSLNPLGISLPELSWQSAKPLSDAYTRGCDLVATYLETEGHPLRVQIYWRALEQRPSAIGFELMLSVQTHLLDSNPGLEVITTASNNASVLTFDSGEGSFAEPRPQSATGPAAIESGCYLVSMAESDWSYFEMIHPGDHHQTILSQEGAQRVIRRKLFERRLEKGVILRSRLQSVFVASTGDRQTAAEYYRGFAASGPTLTA
jgi:hypothetical protein